MSGVRNKKRWVFEALVRDEEDVQGLIAYALYKKSKHELATSLRQQGKSEEEIQKAVGDFHDNVLNSDLLGTYKDRSSRFINSIYQSIYQKCQSEVLKNYNKIKNDDLRKFIKSAEKHAKDQLTKKDILWDQFFSAFSSAVWTIIISIAFIGAVHVAFNEEKRREIMVSAVGKYFSMGEVAKEYQSARPEGPQAQTSKGAS